MDKTIIAQRIYHTGVMAVCRIDTLERCLEIAEGCLMGGCDCMEISYTIPEAGEFIRGVNEKFGDKMLVGAGTVLDGATARNAILNGAKFIIAPCFSEEVAIMCNRYQIPYAPGCTSYTEMMKALEYGATFIKAFPIGGYYGASLVKEFKTPHPCIPILSSGGVKKDNVDEWIANGLDVIATGSYLTKGTKEEIAENARFFVGKMRNSKHNKELNY